ncbi:unnamed protein product [Ilex paraguariensis]|uniref:VQ domain-containing protein n=1 Tax=Ilex paraguariensis TaxID=185542 RepID=A0ABC8V3Z6_9AQUA
MGNRRNNNYQHHLKGINPGRGSEEGITVKYISNPVMVKANNASEFRAIVQELTGQNSDIRSPGNAGTVATSEAIQVHNHTTSKPVVENGVHEYLNTLPSLKLIEDFFWGDASESFSSIQFPPQ